MKSRVAKYAFLLIFVLGIVVFLHISRGSLAAVEDVSTADEASGFVRTYLPSVVRAPKQSQPLLNGDFEQGPVHWYEYSAKGWATILPADYLPVNPRRGSWAAWLGGDYDETNGIWQPLNLPSGQLKLSFYFWVASADLCGYDLALIAINLDEVVDAFWLCTENNTNGWVHRTVDLTPFAGRTVELDILADTDNLLNSNLFVDDVSLSGTLIASVESKFESVDDDVNSITKNSIPGPIRLDRWQFNRSPRISRLFHTYRSGEIDTGQ